MSSFVEALRLFYQAKGYNGLQGADEEENPFSGMDDEYRMKLAASFLSQIRIHLEYNNKSWWNIRDIIYFYIDEENYETATDSITKILNDIFPPITESEE